MNIDFGDWRALVEEAMLDPERLDQLLWCILHIHDEGDEREVFLTYALDKLTGHRATSRLDCREVLAWFHDALGPLSSHVRDVQEHKGFLLRNTGRVILDRDHCADFLCGMLWYLVRQDGVASWGGSSPHRNWLRNSELSSGRWVGIGLEHGEHFVVHLGVADIEDEPLARAGGNAEGYYRRCYDSRGVLWPGIEAHLWSLTHPGASRLRPGTLVEPPEQLLDPSDFGMPRDE
ncbi:MAG: hypothetical protein AAGI01_02275 [Myxococcota bacterium]